MAICCLYTACINHCAAFAAEADFDVQLLDPVPISDTNISAQDLEDGVEVEDESTTRREGYLSYFFRDELDRELLIKRHPDGKLDLHDINILNHEDDTHTTPRHTGLIEQTPTHYQAIPVETVISGDILDNIPEKKILRQLLLVRVAEEEPEHELDFDNAYCFDCGREELYRIAYVSIRDPSEISDPVLRYQPEHDMFILDSKETMPTPMMVNLKHEAQDIGVDFDVDLYSGLPPPASALAALPAGRGTEVAAAAAAVGGTEAEHGVTADAEVSAADVVQALVSHAEVEGAQRESDDDDERGSGGEWEAAAAEEESAGEEVDGLTGGLELDSDDTPDVPAVDLA